MERVRRIALYLLASVIVFAQVGSYRTGRAYARPPAIVTFQIEPTSSKFIVHAHRGGLAWFKGSDHLLAVRQFSGEASLSLDLLNPASLSMTVVANSLQETGPGFTPPQKAIIDREVNEISLETAKYPTITFESTAVTGGLDSGAFILRIAGDITMHGVTRHITIPATVTVNGDELNAKGTFDLKRSDFGVKATSAFHGWVRVKDRLTFTFDINAKRS